LTVDLSFVRYFRLVEGTWNAVRHKARSCTHYSREYFSLMVWLFCVLLVSVIYTHWTRQTFHYTFTFLSQSLFCFRNIYFSCCISLR